jgi:hypothetical protein
LKIRQSLLNTGLDGVLIFPVWLSILPILTPFFLLMQHEMQHENQGYINLKINGINLYRIRNRGATEAAPSDVM